MKNQTLDRALHVARRIHGRDRLFALAEVSHAYLSVGEVAASLEVASEIDDGSLSTQVFTRLAAQFLRQGRSADAAVLVERRGEQLHDSGQDIAYFFSEAVATFASLGFCQDAFKIAQSVSDPHLRADAFNEAVACFIRAGNAEEAEAILRDILEQAKQIDAPDDRAEVLADVAENYFMAGLMALGDEALGMIELDLWKVEPLMVAASLMSEQQQKDAGLTRCREVVSILESHESSARSAHLARVSILAAQLGDADFASRLARQITDTSIKGVAEAKIEWLKHVQRGVLAPPDSLCENLSSVEQRLEVLLWSAGRVRAHESIPYLRTAASLTELREPPSGMAPASQQPLIVATTEALQAVHLFREALQVLGTLEVGTLVVELKGTLAVRAARQRDVDVALDAAGEANRDLGSFLSDAHEDTYSWSSLKAGLGAVFAELGSRRQAERMMIDILDVIRGGCAPIARVVFLVAVPKAWYELASDVSDSAQNSQRRIAVRLVERNRRLF